MYLYFHLCGSVVVHLPCLDFSLFNGSQYRVDERGGGLAVGYLAYHKCLVVQFFNLGPHFQCSPSLSVVVFAHINTSSCGEVGIECEWFAMQIADGGIADIVEVVGEDFR